MSARCLGSCGHIDAALTKARQAGLRVTKGMRPVLELLHGDPAQMSPQDIHGKLRLRGVALGVPTVYRICDNLVKASVLGRQFASDGTMRYFLCTCPDSRHHHHFECRQCGRICELTECPILVWSELLYKTTGMVVESHLLELKGLCAKCAPSECKVQSEE